MKPEKIRPISIETVTRSAATAKTMADVKREILAAAEAATAENVIDVVAELDQGVYVLDEPFVLSAEEHPSLAYVNLTLKAAVGMRPAITSWKSVTAEYLPVEGKPYFKCQLEKDENGEYPRFHDLYFKNKRMQMAKSPVWLNKEALTKEERGAGSIISGGTYMPDDFFAPCDRKGLYAPIAIAKQVKESVSECTELCMYVQWEHDTLRVTGVDLSDTKEFDGETYALITFDEGFIPYFVHGMHRANNMMNRITFFRNDLAFLTEENTYVYDWKNGVLYFIVDAPNELWYHKVMYPTLDSLMEFKGMSNLTVEGLVFTGVSSSYVCDNGYYALLSNLERRQNDCKGDRLRHAAIVTSDVKNLVVKGCEFRGVGCNGIQLCDRTVRAGIYDNIFTDIAMSAVSVGNATNEWDDPENQNIAISVINNYMEHVSYDYPNAAAIFLGISDGARILHNTIKGCGYSGIYGGWGWSPVHFEPGEKVNLRNVEIAYNKISDFMELCRDGAAIYMTGGNAVRSYEKRFNSIHHNYALLSDSGHHDKRGYYLDGGTSHWDMSDNVIHNCLLPLFTQYHVPSQYTYRVRTDGFYSTTPVDMEGNHKPHNDVLLSNCCVETAGIDALLEKYPAARAIAEGAGCDLDLGWSAE